MGVCCIVFDIYRGLFDIFMNFLNIENKCWLKIFGFSHIIFSSHFILFPTFKKNWETNFYFRKTIIL